MSFRLGSKNQNHMRLDTSPLNLEYFKENQQYYRIIMKMVKSTKIIKN